MDKCGDTSCCANCTRQCAFQRVANLKDLGVTIMQYVAGVVKQNTPASEETPLGIFDTDPRNNIFIIINTNSNRLSSNDILPEFDLNKVNCPRCRNRAENVQKMLQSIVLLGTGDVKGICDHCKDKQLSQTTCGICEDIVKKFLETTDTGAKIAAKSWFQQKAPHVNRPLSTERRTILDDKYHLRKEREKSVPDLKMKLKLMIQPEPEIETFKPIRIAEKYIKEKARIIKPTDTPKIVEFPSEESVVTSFLTAFSQLDKKKKPESKPDSEPFKYIFPQDIKKDEDITKATVPNSAELIMDMQDKLLKKTEKEKKTEDLQIQKLNEFATNRDDEKGRLRDKVSVEENPSSFSADSKGTIRKIREKGKTDKKKEIVKKMSTEKSDREDKKKVKSGEEKNKEITENQRDEELSKKDIVELPQKEKSVKIKEGEEKRQRLKDVIETKSQKSMGLLPSSPKDTKAKKSQEDVKAPLAKETKAKKSQDVVTPTKDSKAKKAQEDIRPPPSKGTKTKKDQIDVALPLSKDVKPKKDQEGKEPKLLPSPPMDDTAKKDREDLGPRPSKDVKTKKDKKDLEPPTPKDVKPPLKDTKPEKVQKDVKAPSPKDTKSEKDQKYVKAPPSKDTKLEKSQKDIKAPSTQDTKPEKSQEDVKTSPKKDSKAKKVQEDIEPPTSKGSKTKDQIDVALTLSKDVKPKKDREGKKPKPLPLPPKPLPPPPKADKAKIDRVDVETKIDKEDLKPPKLKEKEGIKEKIQDKKEEKKKEGAKDKETDKKEINVKVDKVKKAVKEEIIKEPVKVEEPSKLLKLLQQKAQPPAGAKGQKILEAVAAKALAMKSAAEEMARMLKEAQDQTLEKLRKDAAAKFGLPEMHGEEYYLFKLDLKEPPKDEENVTKKKLKDLKEFNLKRLKFRDPSYDNLLFKLMERAKEKKARRRKEQIHRTKYKIRSAGRQWSLGSFSIDSDFELAFESLTNVTKFQVVRYKIKHINIVRNIPDKPKPKLQPDPMIFHAVQDKDEPIEILDLEVEPSAPVVKLPPSAIFGDGKGIIRYVLSDRSFIDKGWTVLPTEKIVRQMNIYKVRPAAPEFDWFDRNKTKGVLEYDTGEKMAKFYEDGRGQWYYRNGRVALDYYDCEDTNAQQRFVIYSSGESEDRCYTHPVSVLAMFDYLGNGVVFDHSGKIRVKYNQTEGVILDRNIGPMTRWKWHTLNDPPILKKVMIDTHVDYPDPEIIKLGRGHDGIDKTRIEDEEMLAIELDNFVKEKAKKLKQKFQPFQIRMKALKINEQFSLKIIDQAHIHLHFRDGSTNIKLNLGMILDNQEIIDTETADFVDVANVLERFPPKTDSIMKLQNSLKQTRCLDRLRTAHALRIRPIVPICSVDKLVSAISKPLRPPVVAAAQPNSAAIGCRKPSQTNLYYDTRLI